MSKDERILYTGNGEFLGTTPHQIFHSAVMFGSNDRTILQGCDQLYEPYAISDIRNKPLRVLINKLGDQQYSLGVDEFQPQLYSSLWKAMLLFKAQLINYCWKDTIQPLLLHAGALSKDGKGILLVGDDGTGKTTQTLGLVERGLHFLSDEYGVVDPRSGLLQHYPAPIALRPDSPALKRNFAGLRNKIDSRYYEINTHEIDPARQREHKPVLPAPVSLHSFADVPLRTIVFLEPNFGNTPVLSPYKDSDGIRQKLHRNSEWHSRWSFPPTALKNQFIRDAATKIPAFILSVGDLDRTLDLLEEMVAKI